MAPDRTTEIQRYLGNVNGSENTLVIRNVTYMDSGVYICKVANNISTSTAQFGRYDKEVHISGKSACYVFMLCV